MRTLNARVAAVNSAPDRRQNATPAGPQPLRLLVVDDEPHYRTYVAALTRKLGFWVDVADDGEMALQQLSSCNYDIVIIDYAMPRLSGLDTIRRLRADEALKSIYAMMLTAREDVDTKLTALEAGFDDFLTKTLSEREIVAKLVAARRVALRQRTMSVAIRDLYGLATRDDLTGVFNRRFFISEVERLLIEGAIVNIVLVDLDGFKQINDRYGHLAGDAVLRDVGTALLTNTRPEDIVARFGGDEFIVAIPHVDVATVERIAERLTITIAALRLDTQPAIAVGASAGFASSRLLERPALAQLVNAADRDMYKNKWMRKHPDQRPELYEYPIRERDVMQRLFKVAESTPRLEIATVNELPKILVVEDDEAIRKLLAAALRREALDVDTAADGAEALRFCAAGEYAVIVLDLMMPVLNGFDFLEAFPRAAPSARSVIFVLTAYDDRVVKKLTSPRVHAVVQKPFDVEQFVVTVREVAATWSAQTKTNAPADLPLDIRPNADSTC